MKKLVLILVFSPFLFSLVSCHKDHPPRVPSPSWQVTDMDKYPVSMTAVVQLPSGLLKNRSATDKLGAFIDNECRGVGKRIQLNSSTVFFVLIHGKAAEKGEVKFKYYSAHTSYMYQTDAFLPFTVDGNYGSADAPGILDLKAVK